MDQTRQPASQCTRSHGAQQRKRRALPARNHQRRHRRAQRKGAVHRQIGKIQNAVCNQHAQRHDGVDQSLLQRVLNDAHACCRPLKLLSHVGVTALCHRGGNFQPQTGQHVGIEIQGAVADGFKGDALSAFTVEHARGHFARLPAQRHII